MTKSNWLIIAAAAIVSVFLLGLWYFLGFNKVDNPLDLVLSILWWVGIAAIVFGITRIEKKRREKIRTCFVGTGKLYNSETGIVNVDPVKMVDGMQKVLAGLEYGFDVRDFDANDMKVRCVVRTRKFSDSGEGSPEWRGEVVFAGDSEHAKTFDSKEELMNLVA